MLSVITSRRSGATSATKRAAASARTNRGRSSAASGDDARVAKGAGGSPPARPPDAGRGARARRSADPRRGRQQVRRAASLAGAGGDSSHRRRGRRSAPLLADDEGGARGERTARRRRRRDRHAVVPLPPVAPRLRNLGRRARIGADRADVSVVSRDLRPQRDDDHRDRLHRRAAAGDPENGRGLGRHASRAARRRAQLSPRRGAALSQGARAGRAAEHVRRIARGVDLRLDQHRRRRVPDQLRRPRSVDQRTRRALRPAGHVRGDRLRDPRQRAVLRRLRARRTMAVAASAGVTGGAPDRAVRVWALRAAIVAVVLATWEVVAESGWLFRDVVPTLPVIARAIVRMLGDAAFYANLGVTGAEIAAALAIGGLAGVVTGLVLGASPFLSRAFEGFIYYLGPTPKIIFFPIMILWFGVGS